MPDVERFVDLADGRILFLPKGRGGRAYVVPDDETRVRLIRRYRLIDRTTKLAMSIGLFAALMFRLWAVAAFLVGLGIMLPKWADRVAVESLPEARDPLALQAAAHDSPPKVGTILAEMAFGLSWFVFSMLRFQWNGEMNVDILLSAMASVAVIATAFRAWRDESADDLMWTGHVEPRNSPNEPKYF